MRIRRTNGTSTFVALLLTLVGTTGPGHAGPQDDPLLAQQWALSAIGAPEAWAHSQGKSVVVAVVDTGVDLKHPDLKKRIAKGGLNVLDPDSPPLDDNGHGTHIAGIIAAQRNNGVGIAGVAPKAKILPIKVCDSGGFCEDADTAAGIKHAVDSGADVISISIALGLVTSKTEEGAKQIRAEIERANDEGVIVIAGAGNYSLPFCQDPAAYALCVGATDRDNNRAFYANGDATMTAQYLVAPGGDGHSSLGPVGNCDGSIISTYPAAIERPLCKEAAGYARLNGTSMAAPHVAAVAALLLAEGVEPGEVVGTIIDSAKDLGAPGRDPVYGYGLVNAEAAVEAGAK